VIVARHAEGVRGTTTITQRQSEKLLAVFENRNDHDPAIGRRIPF
jgi:hypothetical protein